MSNRMRGRFSLSNATSEFTHRSTQSPSHSNATPYVYESLGYTDSIRILRLHPSRDFDSSLYCTVEHVRLSDLNLHYMAISYTWGDVTQKQPIYLTNGSEKIDLSVNGCQALRHLRSKKNDRVYWIDAVCIDQSKLDERGHQVRLMDRIYEHAACVVVHLGEHTEGSRLLFQELAAAAEILTSQSSLRGVREPPSKHIANELDELFQRPWFKRVWVLQEVHAKRSVYLMCGADSISSLVLKECYVGYGTGRITEHIWPLPMKLRDVTAHLSVDKSAHQLLWERLFDSRSCLATDARDKVFAVISLLGEKRVVVDHLIDYHMHLERVYTNTAVDFLPIIGLELLNAIRHPHTLNMPSWVPDWSNTLFLEHSRFNPREIWNAIVQAAQRKPKTQLDSEKDSLVLRTTGFRHAAIIKTSPSIFFRDLEDAQAQQIAINNHFEVPYNSKPSPAEESLSRLLHRTETKPMIEVCPFGPEIEEALRQLTNKRRHHFFTRDSIHTDSNFLGIGNVETFFQSLQHCRIALLDDGNLSLVPDAALQGDVLFFLQHCRYPSLLRCETKGAWKVISGDCTLSNFHDRYLKFDDEGNGKVNVNDREQLKII